MSNAKFEDEKFVGTNNFGMWQCQILDVLAQKQLDITLEDRSKEMTHKVWMKLNHYAGGMIQMCLDKDHNYPIIETLARELQAKLEANYMQNSMRTSST